MPVHKVKGGYKWGQSGHTYPSKSGADAQAAAAYANGYEGKSLDAAILLSGSVINRAKHYLAEGEQPPKGVAVKQGARGGKYVEIGGGGAGGREEAAPDGGSGAGHPEPAVKPEFQDVAAHKPDLGAQNFRGQQPQAEVAHWEKELAMSQRRLEVMGQTKAPLAEVIQESKKHDAIQNRLMAAQKKAKAKPAAAGPPAGNLGPKAEAALGDAQKLFEQLKAGQLQNPQEFVDAARRAVQVYEDERKDNGPAANPKRQAIQVAFDRDKQVLDRSLELAKKWKDRLAYAKQKGVPGEELQAVQARMEEAGKEVMSARMQAHESEKALYQFDNPQPKRQPKPRQPKQARPAVQHQPGDLDREMQSPRQMMQQHQQRNSRSGE